MPLMDATVKPNNSTEKACRQIKARWLIPVLLALLFTLGDTVTSNEGTLNFDRGFILIKFVSFLVFFIVLFAFADRITKTLKKSKTETSNKGILSKLDYKLTFIDGLFFKQDQISSAIRLTLIILVFWSPWIYLLKPGIYWSDTSQELLEHFGLATLSDHHPYFMTLILGWFADLGNTLFNSVSSGLFLLACIQCLLAAYFFSRLLWETRDSGLRPSWTFLMILFVAVFPFIPIMFCSVVKDTLSCALFLGFILQLMIIVKSKGEAITKPRVFVAIISFSLLASLVKKTTIYIVIICYIVMLLAYRKKEIACRTASATIVVAIVVLIVFPKIILPANQVEPGGKQEIIATLIQQVAHDVKYNKETVTPKDQNLIDDFLLRKCDEIPSIYNWQIVDPIKERGLQNESRMGEFIRLWAKNTLANPRGHLEAWLGLVSGWITFRIDFQGSPNYMVILTYSGWHDKGINRCTDWNDQMTDGGKLVETIYQTIQSIPLINVFFYRSTWATIVPTLALFLLLGSSSRSRLERLVLIMPLLASLIPLAITPVSIMGGEPTRYVFAIVCTAPFLITASVLLNCRKDNSNSPSQFTAPN